MRAAVRAIGLCRCPPWSPWLASAACPPVRNACSQQISLSRLHRRRCEQLLAQARRAQLCCLPVEHCRLPQGRPLAREWVCERKQQHVHEPPGRVAECVAAGADYIKAEEREAAGMLAKKGSKPRKTKTANLKLLITAGKGTVGGFFLRDAADAGACSCMSLAVGGICNLCLRGDSFYCQV